jgi:hypothetical protein
MLIVIAATGASLYPSCIIPFAIENEEVKK